MKIEQYKWSQNDGWSPDLPVAQLDRQGIVFVFAARPLIQEGRLIRELRDHFKGAAVIGCSTSGEIVSDEVRDDSLVATAVCFEHTRLRTTSARITEAKSSYEVGQKLGQNLNEPSLCHIFVLSDGL